MTIPDPGPAPPPAAAIAECPPAAPAGRRGRLAAAIAGAVATVPGAGLTAGTGVAVATQYRGGTVAGVRLDEEMVTVQIVAHTLPLPPVVDAVQAAVLAVLAQAGDRRPVRVHVADLDLAGRLSERHP